MVNELELNRWLLNAKSGDSITYYVGCSVCEGFGRIGQAGVMWAMYLRGLVNLVQRRAGSFTFEYIAQRTSKRLVREGIKS